MWELSAICFFSGPAPNSNAWGCSSHRAVLPHHRVPTSQLSSGTVSLETAVDPRAKGSGPQDCPPHAPPPQLQAPVTSLAWHPCYPTVPQPHPCVQLICWSSSQLRDIFDLLGYWFLIRGSNSEEPEGGNAQLEVWARGGELPCPLRGRRSPASSHVQPPRNSSSPSFWDFMKSSSHGID